MNARKIASASTVLLKNDGALPLKPTVNIAIIGSEAANPTVHGGGSGQVFPAYVASPVFSIRNHLGFPPPKPRPNNCSDGQYDVGYDYRNTDDQTMKTGVASKEDCCNECANREGGTCNYFTYIANTKDCWMKSTNNNRVADNQAVSGGCHSGPAPAGDDCHNGVCAYVVDSNDADEATAAALKADVSIIFLATSSSEGSDRKSLSVGNDDLVTAVAEAVASNQSKKVVVVAVTPGAILTPWANNVSAVLIPFMPGQEYGNAITDVLYGIVNPR